MPANQTNDLHRAIWEAINGKTKPVGSLGRLEVLAAQIASVQQTLTPSAKRCKLTVFAADHGIAEAGVSVFPQEVTRQMLGNFLAGGAAANVLAQALGVEFAIVDAGVREPTIEHSDLISRRIGNGTENSVERPAMSTQQFQRALDAGTMIGGQGEHEVACYGEMGIANTSSASLVAAKLLNLPVAQLAGRGTGLDDSGFARKQRMLTAAARRTPDHLEPEAAMREYGGFETVMLTGAIMGAAASGKLMLVDGFIATVSALVALRLMPEARPHLVFAHRSAEAGHTIVLKALDTVPLLDLNLRLGEGTGALLAWPLVRAAAAMLSDMASFESAGVSSHASPTLK